MAETEAEALVSFVDAKLRENNEVNLKIIATKEDFVPIREDIAPLKLKIPETKIDIVRWVLHFL